MYRRSSPKARAGFGIVEIVLAIALLGGLSLALTGMFRSILYIQSSATYQKSATLAAQRQIESLRNSNYNDLVSGSTITFTSDLPTNLPSPKTGTVNVTEPVSGLKRVDVTVSYSHGTATKQVKVSSMIGIIGITQ
jgi:type II secretory pathway pseudopilin PulG